MVVSMTGYGRSKKESNQFTVSIEIKTVNHRFSEFNLRMPRQLLKMEDKIKKTLAEHIQRGRIEVFVTISGEGIVNRNVNVDWELLDEYYQNISAIKKKYSIQNGITLLDVLRQELISIEEREAGNEELDQIVLSTVEEACQNLKQMRLMEGKELEKDLNNHLNLLSMRISQVRELSPKVVHQYQERLTKRMQEFVSGQLDETRILTEVAIFADKADINEELTRLQSHIIQFEKTLCLNEPIGRKLDFLIQEMNREVNTIGSKSNDSSIAGEVVEMKCLLEKMKEQVQNIE